MKQTLKERIIYWYALKSRKSTAMGRLLLPVIFFALLFINIEEYVRFNVKKHTCIITLVVFSMMSSSYSFPGFETMEMASQPTLMLVGGTDEEIGNAWKKETVAEKDVLLVNNESGEVGAMTGVDSYSMDEILEDKALTEGSEGGQNPGEAGDNIKAEGADESEDKGKPGNTDEAEGDNADHPDRTKRIEEDGISGDAKSLDEAGENKAESTDEAEGDNADHPDQTKRIEEDGISGDTQPQTLAGNAEVDVDQLTFDRDDWKLILVNKQHPIPENYEFELGTIKGAMKCDARIIPDLMRMLQGAKADDVSLVICSPYRDMSRQVMLFQNKVEKYMQDGMSYMDAYKTTSQAVTIPGSSEHQIGLALDIVTEGYPYLNEGFEDTAAGKWLAAHSAEYGFILRYPRGKEYVTSIEYEPWHFRYVGRDAALFITEKGLSLEEFSDYLKNMPTERSRNE